MAKTDIKISELVDKVSRAELLLPEMQRKYVWPGTRVRDLLDSLYRNYPTGTILTWETDEDIQTRELAVQSTRTPATSSKLLLLDGQQRITSLAAILSGEPVSVRNRRRPIDILFNLDHPDSLTEVLEVIESDTLEDREDIDDEEDADDDNVGEEDAELAVSDIRDIQLELRNRTFVVSSQALRNDPRWVPVSDIFKKSDRDILKPLGINSDDEKWDKYADRLSKIRKIADYQYVMQVLQKDMSYEEVTEIFVRVNSLGIKLRGSDLALAQITSKWIGFMKVIEDFAKEIKNNEDYIIESGLPVRTLVVFATKQSRFKTVGKIPLESMKKSWILAKDGLRFATNFVISNLGITNLSHLSSPFLLIPIAVYSVLKNGKLTPDEEKNISKWFFLAHMRGHYSMGSSESILEADLSILFKKKSLEDLISQLQQHVKKFTVDSGDLSGKGIRSPFFSMLYFVLEKAGAKDWFSGLKLSDRHAGKAHKLQYHHIFPKSLLKDARYERREINEIANMAFIGGKTNRHITNKEPKVYFEKEVIAKRGEDALTSQLIPLDKSLWEISNYNGFLLYRRQAVADAINNFMKICE
jgi:hypothetical protein